MATRGELPEIVGNLDDRLAQLETVVYGPTLNKELSTGVLREIRGLVGGLRLDLTALHSYRISVAKAIHHLLVGDRYSRALDELENDFLDLYEEAA